MKTASWFCVLTALLIQGGALGRSEQSNAKVNAVALDGIVPAGSSVTKIAGGMKFTEGPVWVPRDGGYLLFSDLFGNELKTWSPAAGVRTFRAPSQKVDGLNNYNGNTLDREGRLITAGHGERRLTRTENDGQVVTLVDRHKGRKLNSPNDVVVRSDGLIYFTDPDYGITTGQKEQPGNYVYRLDPRTGELVVAVDDFLQPNGLCFSPDEKKLYIADSSFERHHIRVFDVTAGGLPTNGRIFCTIADGLPDGIRCDNEGRLYSSCRAGVQVYAPNGNLVGTMAVPEEQTANLCFGGADRKTLFIAATTSIYLIKLSVAGAR